MVSIADAVERAGELGRFAADAADHLRHVVRVERRVAGIDPLRREGEEEIFAGLEAAGLEHRLHELLGGARIGRRLEDDQHPRVQLPTICSTAETM